MMGVLGEPGSIVMLAVSVLFMAVQQRPPSSETAYPHDGLSTDTHHPQHSPPDRLQARMAHITVPAHMDGTCQTGNPQQIRSKTSSPLQAHQTSGWRVVAECVQMEVPSRVKAASKADHNVDHPTETSSMGLTSSLLVHTRIMSQCRNENCLIYRQTS